eukprot:TRINITY_DN10142_c0_g1_i5.p1 TRINITY_DN10142_c0_g1~~TRINITY_DN10142_c0_g1_i5.p1  ORF type:complete len:2240 (-),score=577.07 TRINITY_DN10142_c0_g1_i5:109-6828(-)
MSTLHSPPDDDASAERLTVQQARQVFRAMNPIGDKMDPAVLTDHLIAQGLDEHEAKSQALAADQDGDGMICEEEFVMLLTGKPRSPTAEVFSRRPSSCGATSESLASSVRRPQTPPRGRRTSFTETSSAGDFARDSRRMSNASLSSMHSQLEQMDFEREETQREISELRAELQREQRRRLQAEEHLQQVMDERKHESAVPQSEFEKLRSREARLQQEFDEFRDRAEFDQKQLLERLEEARSSHPEHSGSEEGSEAGSSPGAGRRPARKASSDLTQVIGCLESLKQSDKAKAEQLKESLASLPKYMEQLLSPLEAAVKHIAEHVAIAQQSHKQPSLNLEDIQEVVASSLEKMRAAPTAPSASGMLSSGVLHRLAGGQDVDVTETAKQIGEMIKGDLMWMREEVKEATKEQQEAARSECQEIRDKLTDGLRAEVKTVCKELKKLQTAVATSASSAYKSMTTNLTPQDVVLSDNHVEALRHDTQSIAKVLQELQRTLGATAAAVGVQPSGDTAEDEDGDPTVASMASRLEKLSSQSAAIAADVHRVHKIESSTTATMETLLEELRNMRVQMEDAFISDSGVMAEVRALRGDVSSTLQPVGAGAEQCGEDGHFSRQVLAELQVLRQRVEAGGAAANDSSKRVLAELQEGLKESVAASLPVETVQAIQKQLDDLKNEVGKVRPNADSKVDSKVEQQYAALLAELQRLQTVMIATNTKAGQSSDDDAGAAVALVEAAQQSATASVLVELQRLATQLSDLQADKRAEREATGAIASDLQRMQAKLDIAVPTEAGASQGCLLRSPSSKLVLEELKELKAAVGQLQAGSQKKLLQDEVQQLRDEFKASVMGRSASSQLAQVLSSPGVASDDSMGEQLSRVLLDEIQLLRQQVEGGTSPDGRPQGIIAELRCLKYQMNELLATPLQRKRRHVSSAEAAAQQKSQAQQAAGAQQPQRLLDEEEELNRACSVHDLQDKCSSSSSTAALVEGADVAGHQAFLVRTPYADTTGEYSAYGQCQGFPVYRHKGPSGSMYIYKLLGKHWAIGDTLGSDEACHAVQHSEAETPDLAQWPDNVSIIPVRPVDVSRAPGMLRLRSPHVGIEGGYLRSAEEYEGYPAYLNGDNSKCLWHSRLTGRWILSEKPGDSVAFNMAASDEIDPTFIPKSAWEMQPFHWEEIAWDGYDASSSGFFDREFPADASSVGFQWRSQVHTWRRAGRLRHVDDSCEDVWPAHLHPTDCLQELAADARLAAALAALAEFPGVLEQLFEPWGRQGDGKYQVSLYDIRSSGWVDLVVDDLIPCCESGKPLFTRSLNDSWLLVLEKALCKLAGSYDGMLGEQMSWIWQAVTGLEEQLWYSRDDATSLWKQCTVSPERQRTLMQTARPEDRFACPFAVTAETVDDLALFDLLHQWDFANFPMAAMIAPDLHMLATASAEDADAPRQDGLLAGHAYAILRVVEVADMRFVQLRCAWSIHEWLGDWSAKSEAWTKHPGLTAKLAYSAAGSDNSDELGSDGIFWMSFADFCAIFSSVYVSPAAMKTRRGSHRCIKLKDRALVEKCSGAFQEEWPRQQPVTEGVVESRAGCSARAGAADTVAAVQRATEAVSEKFSRQRRESSDEQQNDQRRVEGPRQSQEDAGSIADPEERWLGDGVSSEISSIRQRTEELRMHAARAEEIRDLVVQALDPPSQQVSHQPSALPLEGDAQASTAATASAAAMPQGSGFNPAAEVEAQIAQQLWQVQQLQQRLEVQQRALAATLRQHTSGLSTEGDLWFPPESSVQSLREEEPEQEHHESQQLRHLAIAPMPWRLEGSSSSPLRAEVIANQAEIDPDAALTPYLLKSSPLPWKMENPPPLLDVAREKQKLAHLADHPLPWKLCSLPASPQVSPRPQPLPGPMPQSQSMRSASRHEVEAEPQQAELPRWHELQMRLQEDLYQLQQHSMALAEKETEDHHALLQEQDIEQKDLELLLSQADVDEPVRAAEPQAPPLSPDNLVHQWQKEMDRRTSAEREQQLFFEHQEGLLQEQLMKMRFMPIHASLTDANSRVKRAAEATGTSPTEGRHGDAVGSPAPLFSLERSQRHVESPTSSYMDMDALPANNCDEEETAQFQQWMHAAAATDRMLQEQLNDLKRWRDDFADASSCATPASPEQLAVADALASPAAGALKMNVTSPERPSGMIAVGGIPLTTPQSASAALQESEWWQRQQQELAQEARHLQQLLERLPEPLVAKDASATPLAEELKQPLPSVAEATEID